MSWFDLGRVLVHKNNVRFKIIKIQTSGIYIIYNGYDSKSPKCEIMNWVGTIQSWTWFILVKNQNQKLFQHHFLGFQPRKKPATSWHPDQFLSNGVKNQSGNLGNAWGRFNHRNAGFFRRQFLDVGRSGVKGGYSAILTYSAHVQRLGCTVRKLRNGQTPIFSWLQGSQWLDDLNVTTPAFHSLTMATLL